MAFGSIPEVGDPGVGFVLGFFLDRAERRTLGEHCFSQNLPWIWVERHPGADLTEMTIYGQLSRQSGIFAELGDVYVFRVHNMQV